MDIECFSNPLKIGPGVWFKIHTDAVAATTDELKRAFVLNINFLCDMFKCKKCQGHFREFIDSHPLRNYWDFKYKGKDAGFFKWSWEFHNHANQFLKKYQPTFDEAYSFFSDADSGVCTDCGGEILIKQPSEKDTKPTKQNIPPILAAYMESVSVTQKPFRMISIAHK